MIYQEETAKRSKVCGCKKGDVSKPSLVKALQQFTNSAGIYLLHYQLGSTTVIHDENPGLKRGSQPSRLTLVGMGHIIETGITTRDYKGHGSPEEEGWVYLNLPRKTEEEKFTRNEGELSQHSRTATREAKGVARHGGACLWSQYLGGWGGVAGQPELCCKILTQQNKIGVL